MSMKDTLHWYAVHVIEAVTVAEEHNMGKIAVYENLLFVNANDIEHAKERAFELAKESDDAGFDPSQTFYDLPCKYTTAGIRKVVEVEVGSVGNWVADGVELTYWEYELENRAALEALLNGKPTELDLFD